MQRDRRQAFAAGTVSRYLSPAFRAISVVAVVGAGWKTAAHVHATVTIATHPSHCQASRRPSVAARAADVPASITAQARLVGRVLGHSR